MNKIFFHLCKIIPDKLYLQLIWHRNMGGWIDFSHPCSFNEKLQWLKIYDRKPFYTTLVDKYAVKRFVMEKIGEQYIIPTLGIYEHFRDINLEELPDSFVLKCTHDSGSVVIVRNKKEMSWLQVENKLERALKHNYFWNGREWPYKKVHPRIIIEKLLKNEEQNIIQDYKVLCFNGIPKYIEVHTGRFSNQHTQDFFTTDWKRTDIIQGCPISETIMDPPECLDNMISLSRTLSAGIPFIRVDWYVENKKLYFGELTFYDGGGFEKFDNQEYDEMLGGFIQLPII